MHINVLNCIFESKWGIATHNHVDWKEKLTFVFDLFRALEFYTVHEISGQTNS